ncbi:hypothetical protein [Spirosoma endophyticum]|uniref:Uncharacterized protein n=1 Tax=Spirosoma endophyticum TaxID=662367 RepID=A0A1I2I5W9_9BACT|nr:hypothetical protein [Spirosoma endophyticum]SFF37869.1 hypothetical protein SAMN05216167_15813 [Spirosoma endophyticum]
MNENKFLKNLNLKPTSSTPIPAAASPSPAPQPVAPSGYDPIQRLVDELSRQSTAIEGLNERFNRWEKRPRGASPAELDALMQAARQGVEFTLNSQKIAELLLPELTKGMPTLNNLKAATDERVNEIRAVGLATAERIEQASTRAVNRIEWASRSKADVLASRIGFSSWQSALLIFTGFLVLVGGAMLANQQREAALAQARTQTQAVREFTDWVKTQPEGKRLYDRYYHP